MKTKPTFLLINPWIYDFAAYDLYFKPLGLLTLAGNLEKLGCDVILIDCMDRLDPYLKKHNFIKNHKYGKGKFHYEIIDKPKILSFYPRYYKRYGIPYEEIKKRISELKNIKIDGVLVTSIMNYWYPAVFDMVNLVKKILKNIPVFLGGIYATLMYTHALKNSNADFVIPGNNIYEIIKEIYNNLDLDLKNLKNIKDFNDQEEPLFNLYSDLSYIVASLSFGCPFKCSYCASRLLYKDYIIKNIKKVSQSIKKYVDKYNIKDLAFYDDSLLYNFNDVLKKFLQELENYSINYHTPNGLHIKYITEDIAKYLYDHRFKMIRLSLETSNPLRQKSTGNKTTNKEFINAMKYLHNSGFTKDDLEVYILFGFPDQDFNEIRETIRFVKENGGKPKIVEYSLIPGTLDYKKYFKNKFIDPLLENNSLFYLKFTKFSINDLLELRNLTKDNN